MTPLRQRMLEELQRRNYSQAAIDSYILAVKVFAEYFRKSSELLGGEVVGGLNHESDRYRSGEIRTSAFGPCRSRCVPQHQQIRHSASGRWRTSVARSSAERCVSP